MTGCRSQAIRAVWALASWPPSSPAPEERRLVTVLFADVVGSTSLGESLDPEDVRGLLGRLFALAQDVFGAHGGTLEKFIGG